jgi:hypothetical protein
MQNWLHTLFLTLCLLATPSYSQFFEEGRFVRDVRNNLTWYRCTLGQVWNSDTETCSGETVRLSQDQISIAVQQAEHQLGGQWRLPTKDELESLICVECAPPKIRQKYFPNIEREAYWSGTKNRWNRRMYWSVNFMTGHAYSRFFSYQQLPVLLVRDR